MSSNREDCKPELWTINKLITVYRGDSPQHKEEIIIPRFQRRLVWSHEKQKALIQSIKNGYPIGSLLLYSEVNRDGRTTYRLIDGLQRSFAILKYVEKPNQFFDVEEITENTVRTVARELGMKQSEETESQVRRFMAEWVKSKSGFAETDDWDKGSLIRALIEKLLNITEEHEEFNTAFVQHIMNPVINNQLAKFLQEVRTSANISSTQIPVNIYTGDSTKLPEIFELLNSSGVALSKYEIYAARWMDTKLNIKNKDIRVAIQDKYLSLNEEGFTVEALEQERDSSTDTENQYTLFEYLFGLGQILAKDWPYLFKSVKEDVPSSAAFNLVTACIGLRLQEMEELDRRLLRRSNFDINKLEKSLLNSVAFVDKHLQPIVQINRRKRPTIHHSELQIISLIASAFQFRYNIKDAEFAERGDRTSNLRKLDNHLIMYYLYDLVRDYWRGTGDAKLYETTSNERYLGQLPSREQWIQILDIWFHDDQLKMRQRNRYVKEASLELLLLKYIYTHKLSVVQNTKSFHVEHLIPVAKLRSSLKQSDDSEKGLPINCVANLALLEKGINIEKGDRTFVQHLTDACDRGRINQKKFREQLAELEKLLLCPIGILPPDPIVEEGYFNFLNRRFDELKSEFLNSWSDRIPNN